MANYQFKNNSRKTSSFSTTKRNAKPFFLVSFVVLFLLVVAWPALLRTPLVVIGTPLWDFKNNVFDKSSIVSGTGTYFTSKNSLKKEVDNLSDQILLLKSANFELEILREENLRLKQALGRKEEFKDAVMANILSRPNKTLYDTFLLDVGMLDGIRVGDVFSYEKFNILGEIIRVDNKTSLARLFSSPDIESRVVVSDSIATNATGIGGGNFEIIMPKDITVSEGMSVRLEEFPGTKIGYIESIKLTDSDSFQRILVRNPVNIFQVNEVLVYHKQQ